jgi:cell division protein FtsB
VVYDILAQRGGAQLHSQLVFLYQVAVGFGDGPPTAQEREVFARLSATHAALREELAALEAGPLAALEAAAAALGLPRILLPAP